MTENDFEICTTQQLKDDERQVLFLEPAVEYAIRMGIVDYAENDELHWMIQLYIILCGLVHADGLSQECRTSLPRYSYPSPLGTQHSQCRWSFLLRIRRNIFFVSRRLEIEDIFTITVFHRRWSRCITMTLDKRVTRTKLFHMLYVGSNLI